MRRHGFMAVFLAFVVAGTVSALRGNICAPQTAQTGPDGKGSGAGVQKFAVR